MVAMVGYGSGEFHAVLSPFPGTEPSDGFRDLQGFAQLEFVIGFPCSDGCLMVFMIFMLLVVLMLFMVFVMVGCIFLGCF